MLASSQCSDVLLWHASQSHQQEDSIGCCKTHRTATNTLVVMKYFLHDPWSHWLIAGLPLKDLHGIIWHGECISMLSVLEFGKYFIGLISYSVFTWVFPDPAPFAPRILNFRWSVKAGFNLRSGPEIWSLVLLKTVVWGWLYLSRGTSRHFLFWVLWWRAKGCYGWWRRRDGLLIYKRFTY